MASPPAALTSQYSTSSAREAVTLPWLRALPDHWITGARMLSTVCVQGRHQEAGASLRHKRELSISAVTPFDIPWKKATHGSSPRSLTGTTLQH